MSFREIKCKGAFKTYAMNGLDFDKDGQVEIWKFKRSDDDLFVVFELPTSRLSGETYMKVLGLASSIFETQAGTIWEDSDARVEYDIDVDGIAITRVFTVQKGGRIILARDHCTFTNLNDAMTFAEAYMKTAK